MEEVFLDDTLTQSPVQLQALPIVRVLTGVWLTEVGVWAVITFCTLVAPLLVGPDTIPKAMLVLLIIGLTLVTLGYVVFVFTPPKEDIEQCHLRQVSVQTGLLLVIVSTAVLLHPVAATCFALALWCSALAVLLRLVARQDAVSSPREFAALMLVATLLVFIICTLQQLSLADFAINALALVLALLANAIRWDWLVNHALHISSSASQRSASTTVEENQPSTYHLKEEGLAWNELYTWTVRRRIIDRCFGQ